MKWKKIRRWSKKWRVEASIFTGREFGFVRDP
jgi:hypothetical protein